MTKASSQPDHLASPEAGETSPQSAAPAADLHASDGLTGPRAASGPLPFIGAGLLGAALAWLLIDQFYGSIPRADVPELAAGPPGGAVGERLAVLNFAAFRWNVALAAGLFGAAVGGLFGAAAGLQRTARAAGGGAILGVLLGALCGAVGGYIGTEIGGWTASLSLSYQTILTHVTMWGAAGAGIGLAAGLARRAPGSLLVSAIGCIAAGLLGAVLYSPLAALAFPGDDSDLAVPDGTLNRFVWVLLPAVLMAVILWLSSSGRLGEAKGRRRRDQ